MKDAEGTSNSSLGSRNSPFGGRSGGTLEPYHGPSCAGGTIWTHYEIDGGPFLEDNPSGTKNPSCGIACTTPFHIEPMICVMGGSARICHPGVRSQLPPRSPLRGSSPLMPPSRR